MSYAKATTPAAFKHEIAPLLVFPIADQLKNVAQTFVDLQEARHLADYDVSTKWDRIGALQSVIDSQDAFADWQAIKATPNARIFLFDLLLRKSWARS